jgi:hypothetical protein
VNSAGLFRFRFPFISSHTTLFNPLTEHYFSHQSNRLSVVCVVDGRDGDTEWNRRNCVWLVGEMAIQNGIGGIDYMLQRKLFGIGGIDYMLQRKM